jgi:uncharacterized phiE125 gp8 family phage protein
MSLSTLVPPAGEPVSLALGKAFLRVGYDSDDELIASMLVASRAHIELKTGLRLMQRTYEWSLAGCDFVEALSDGLDFQISPFVELVSVVSGGEEMTSRFEVRGGVRPKLYLKRGQIAPSISGAVYIRFSAGFGNDASDVPDDLKQAILMLTKQAYGQDTQNNDLKSLVDDLIAPWRRVSV